VVDAGNGWVYLFSTDSSWKPIRAVEVATGRAVESAPNQLAGNYGKRLADDALLANSIGNLVRFDLAADGTPVRGSSYDNFDHEVGSRFWISDDGGRLYGDSGNSFWLNDGTLDDVQYAGSLSGYRPRFVDHGGGTGLVAVVGQGPGTWERSTDVVLLDDRYLAVAELHPLPWMELGGSWTPIFGRYVFFESWDNGVPSVRWADWTPGGAGGVPVIGTGTGYQRAPHTAGKKVAYEFASTYPQAQWVLRYNETDALSVDGTDIDVGRWVDCDQFFQPKVGGADGNLILFTGFGNCSSGTLPLYIYDLIRPGDPPTFIDDLGMPGFVPAGYEDAWLHGDGTGPNATYYGPARPHYDISKNQVVYAKWNSSQAMFEILTYRHP
jgi:hypothetical protein